MSAQRQRIVLACSGSLDALLAIPWLAEHRNAEVVTVTLNIGGAREPADVRERALAAGAVRAHVLDVREEFLNEYVLPTLQARTMDQGVPFGSELETALIVKRLRDVARMERSRIVAHAASRAAADRFEVALGMLDPSIEVIPVARSWTSTDWERLLQNSQPYISGEALPADSAPCTNVWTRIIRWRALDGANEPAEEAYTITRAPQDCPDHPAYVDIEFDAGVPVRANGVEMPILELVESLETIAGCHGVGRLARSVNPDGGWREVCEAPAALVLHTAYAALYQMVLSRDVNRIAADLATPFADLIREGAWFSQAREAIGAFVSRFQDRLAGRVRLELLKGDCRVVACSSRFAGDSRPYAVPEEAGSSLMPSRDGAHLPALRRR